MKISLLFAFNFLLCPFGLLSQGTLVEKDVARFSVDIVVEDLDNDGIYDLIEGENEIKILKGKPNLEFYLPKFLDTCRSSTTAGGSSFFQLYAKDIDLDGLSDIIYLSNIDNKVVCYKNLGDLNFEAQLIFQIIGNYTNFLCYDYDLDGDLDIRYTRDNQLFRRNNTNGQFSEEILDFTYFTPDIKISNKDVNQDGREDLIFRTIAYDAMTIYYNFATNPFQYGSAISTINYTIYNTYSSIETYDFTNDGEADFVGYNSSSLVFIHDNITTTIVSPINLQTYNLLFAQIDADPEPEVLLTNANNTYVSDFDSALLTFSVPSLLINYALLPTVDFDSNGFNDFISGNSDGERITLNDGSGNLTTSPIIFSEASFAQTGDIDGDGLEDIMIKNDNDLFLQTGIDNWEYSLPTQITSTLTVWQFRLCDLDNDSDLDVAFSLTYYLNNTTNDGVGYMINDGTGSYGPMVIIDTLANSAKVFVYDVDNNGYMDIVSQYTYLGTPRICTYFNTNLSFTTSVVAYQSSLSLSHIEDLDLNGTSDLICTFNTNLISYEFENGSFNPPTTLYTSPIYFGIMSYTDIDGDQDKDYLCGWNSNPNEVFFLIKEPNGFVQSNFTLTNPMGNSLTAQFFDVDNDVDVDFLVKKSAGFDIYFNDGVGTYNYGYHWKTRSTTGVFLPDYEGDSLKHVFVRDNFTIREIYRFQVGDSPILLQDSIYACPGVMQNVSVQNPSDLGDNLTWGLFADSINGAMLQSNTSGIFLVSSNYTRTFFIKSIGGSTFNGPASTFTLVVEPSNFSPIVALDSTTYEYAYLSLIDNAGYTGTWEYSLDNGTSWGSLTQTVGQFFISGLMSNTVYNALVRPALPVGSCPVSPSTNVSFITECENFAIFDTIEICQGSLVIFPDFTVVDVNQNLTQTSNLLSQTGCDSTIYTTVNLTANPTQIPMNIDLFALPSDDNLCTGALLIQNQGYSPFTYSIDGVADFIGTGNEISSDLCPGIYELSISDNCGFTETISFVIADSDNFSFNDPFPDSVVLDSLATLQENCSSDYSFIDTAYIDSVWYNGNLATVIWSIVDQNGINYDTVTYSLNYGYGIYWLQYSIFCPTGSPTDYYIVTEAINNNPNIVTSATEEQYALSSIVIHPNPVNDLVKIAFEGDQLDLVVYDITGKVILSKTIQNKDEVSLLELSRGIYYFNLTSNHRYKTIKVIKI